MEYRAIRGVEDLIPPESLKYEKVVSTFKGEVEKAGFEEVILPIFEEAKLFTRSVGQTTDIVEKEMYIFEDKGGRVIALRPEGTASAARAYIEHAIFTKEPYTKWFYVGPMFRFERPQAGRKRQFFQAGAEIFGLSSPGSDAELIKLADEILKALKVKTELEINSIGCPECRPKYREALVSYLKEQKEKLCRNCQERLNKNPLRVLDCKEEECKKVAEEAPKITQHLCSLCSSHFEKVKEYLSLLKVSYRVNPLLVRGLDYYTKTVFEFKSSSLGAQSTVLAGGRYDNLVEELGGPKTPALGFAMGIDRVMLLMEEFRREREGVFIAYRGEEAYRKALTLEFRLREKDIRSEVDHRSGSFKSQLKVADRRSFKFALIIGEDEVKNDYFTLKELSTGKQERINSFEELLARL